MTSRNEKKLANLFVDLMYLAEIEIEWGKHEADNHKESITPRIYKHYLVRANTIIRRLKESHGDDIIAQLISIVDNKK